MTRRPDPYPVVLHGAYHTDNFGDVLLMLLMKDWLREAAPEIEVRLPFVPPATDRHLRPGAARGYRALWTASSFVYGGGGYFGAPPTDLLRWNLRLAWRHLLPGLLMALLGRDVAICGVGAGPLTHPLPRAMLRAIVRRARLITVRDEPSRDLLLGLGADPASVVTTADLALVLRPDDLPSEAVAHAKAWLGKLPPGPRLGIHLSLPPSEDARVRHLSQDVVAFATTRPELQVVALTDQGGAVKQVAATQELGALLSGRCHPYVYDDPWRLAALLAELDMVITTKLHVGIVAVALGTPVLSYPSHTKTPRFYAQIGAPQVCHPIAGLAPGMVLDHLRRFGQPEAEIRVPHDLRVAAEDNRVRLQAHVRGRIGARRAPRTPPA